MFLAASIANRLIAQRTSPGGVAHTVVALLTHTVLAALALDTSLAGGTSPTRMTGAGVDIGTGSMGAALGTADRSVAKSALVACIAIAFKGDGAIAMHTTGSR